MYTATISARNQNNTAVSSVGSHIYVAGNGTSHVCQTTSTRMSSARPRLERNPGGIRSSRSRSRTPYFFLFSDGLGSHPAELFLLRPMTAAGAAAGRPGEGMQPAQRPGKPPAPNKTRPAEDQSRRPSNVTEVTK